MLSLLNPPYSGVFQIQTMRTFGELARTWSSDVYLRTSQPTMSQEKRMGEAGNSWNKLQQRTKTVKKEMRHPRRKENRMCVYLPPPVAKQ